jgi:hypothetical protein
MRSKRYSMQSDFIPEKMKKAKWVLIKNLEIAQEKEALLKPKVSTGNTAWWRRWWNRLKPGFLRLWW